MNYNFDRIVDRKTTNSTKWEREIAGEKKCDLDVIPMWIADADFASMPEIVETLRNRVDREIYGYPKIPDAFFDAVMYWQKSRFGLEVLKEEIHPLPNVVAGVTSAIFAFTKEGDGVILQPPVYNPFAAKITQAGRQVVNNPIIKENGDYRINFEQLEELAKDPNNKLMFLCNPHNPIGKIWVKEDLIKIADICLENNVILVCDEIHADFVYGGRKHCSLLTFDEKYLENTFVISSAGKSFNIAGLCIGYSIIPNKTLREKFQATQESLCLNITNIFGFEAVIAAYSPAGEAWFDAQCAYIEKNIEFLVDYIEINMPKVKIIKPEATYICWLDFSAYEGTTEDIIAKMEQEAAVICIAGNVYGEGGEKHVRMNLACPLSTVKEAIERIQKIF